MKGSFDINHKFFFFEVVDGKVLGVVSRKIYPLVREVRLELPHYNYALHISPTYKVWANISVESGGTYMVIHENEIPSALRAYALLLGIY